MRRVHRRLCLIYANVIRVSPDHGLSLPSSDCKHLPVPEDYDDLLSYYTKRGFRVIAMAGKSLEGLTWLKAQKMKRSAPLPMSAR